MKILIISFDKKLSEELKEAFSQEEVITVKNSEEALKIAPTLVDVVIYDAISGAISEEDINNIYQKKFSEAKYVILYDELFPVNADNLMPENKVLVPREEKVEKIKEVALSSETPAEVNQAQESQPESEPSQATEESPPLDDTLLELTAIPEIEEKPAEEEIPSPQGEELLEEIETTSIETAPEDTQSHSPEQVASPDGKRKILLVSFDATLIDSIKGRLASNYEITVVKNTKQAIDKGADSELIIYDAISGVIAEKGLLELSENPQFSVKPYLILIDDLFPIEVDKIPLSAKKSLSRDATAEDIEKAIQELIAQAPAIKVEESPQEEVPAEPPTEVIEEEEIPALENLDKIVEELEKGLEEPVEEEPVEEPESVVAQEETPPIMEQEVEGKAPEEDRKEIASKHELPEEISLEGIEEVIKDAVMQKLSSLKLENLVSDLVKDSVKEALSGVDFAQIIREETRKLLKERIEELLS
jgi:DNA-binding NarL/FixJ family response regulator